MRGVADKVAIVTGGAASIGRAIVETFHRSGLRVVIAARSRDKGEALASQLGPSALFQHTDITDAIRRRFEARGWKMPEINRRQAMVPDGAVVIVTTNLLVDLTYAMLDPRIRY